VRGPKGQSARGPPAMMVIDAGTIQTPQTLQQIKRLFCKVVKEQNGKRGAMSPLLCHTVSLSLVAVVSSVPLGGELLQALLAHSYCTADASCAHTGSVNMDPCARKRLYG